MKHMIFPIRCVLFLGVSVFSHPLWAGSHEFRDCYARWDEGKLTVGNTRFERPWRAADSGLAAVSFVMMEPDVEWLSDAASNAGKYGAERALGSFT